MIAELLLWSLTWKWVQSAFLFCGVPTHLCQNATLPWPGTTTDFSSTDYKMQRHQLLLSWKETVANPAWKANKNIVTVLMLLMIKCNKDIKHTNKMDQSTKTLSQARTGYRKPQACTPSYYFNPSPKAPPPLFCEVSTPWLSILHITSIITYSPDCPSISYSFLCFIFVSLRVCAFWLRIWIFFILDK